MTKKVLSILLSVLMICGTITCMFTIGVSAAGVQYGQNILAYSGSFEDYEVGTEFGYMTDRPTADTEGKVSEPVYGDGKNWGFNFNAGYITKSSTDGKYYQEVYDTTLYGTDGTAKYTQTYTSSARTNTNIPGEYPTVIKNKGYNGSSKSLGMRASVVRSLAIPVEAGKTYKLSYYAYYGNTANKIYSSVLTTVNISDQTNKKGLVHIVRDGDLSEYIYDRASYEGKADWFKVEHEFTVPEGGNMNFAYLAVYAPYAGEADILYIDDLSCVEVMEVSDLQSPLVKFVDASDKEITGSNEYAKTNITANADGTVTVSVDYNKESGAYSFKGWYSGETLVSGNESATISNEYTDLTAVITSNNILATSSSYENEEAGTDLYYATATPTAVDSVYPEPAAYGDGKNWAFNFNGGYITKNADDGKYTQMVYSGTFYDTNGSTVTQPQSSSTSRSDVTTTYFTKVVDSKAKTGTKSLSMRASVVRSLAIPVEAGETYKVSYYAYYGNTNNAFLSGVTTTVNIGGSKGLQHAISGEEVFKNYVYTRYATKGGSDWFKVEHEFTVPKNGNMSTAYLAIYAPYGSEADTVYIDDLVAYKVKNDIGVTTAYNNSAAIMHADYSSTGKNGLRVYNEIKTDWIGSAGIVEYGSVAARTARLEGEEVTLGNGVIGVAYSEGTAYSTARSAILWETKDDANIYTSYLTSIPEKYYAEDYTVRAYAIDKDGNVYYGEEVNVSVYQIANSIDCGNTADGGEPTDIDKNSFYAFVSEKTSADYKQWCADNGNELGALYNAEYSEEVA